MKELIRKYALQNAIRFDGKANPGNIIGKVLGENPKLREKGKELMKEAEEIMGEDMMKIALGYMTQADLARIEGVTREAIRQRYNIKLNKLRKKLKQGEFIEEFKHT